MKLAFNYTNYIAVFCTLQPIKCAAWNFSELKWAHA
jgi:hypothetical protein